MSKFVAQINDCDLNIGRKLDNSKNVLFDCKADFSDHF